MLNLIVLSIPIYFVLIALEATYDYFAKRQLYRLNDAIGNISCGIFEQVTGVFAKVFTVALFYVVSKNVGVFDIPTTWPWLIVLFIGIDFFYYWGHRHSHTVNLFWTGHVVHHQSEDYNLSVALRQGAIQKFFVSFYYVPLAFLGFDAEAFLFLGALQTLYQFWIHTELIEKMGMFGFLFNTPSHHRVHHGRDPIYIDKNHGGTLIVWDRLFGTFQKEVERPNYGITTPINTFNPIAAHIHPWKNLWEDVKRTPGGWNKVKLLFAKPGWLPQEAGGFRAPQPVPEDYKKYDVQLPLALNGYLLFQFFVVMGGTALFLFNTKNMEVPAQVFATVGIVVSVMLVGMLFSRWKPAWAIEAVRLLGVPVLLWYFIGASVGLLPFAIGAAGFVLFSGGWLWYAHRQMPVAR